MTKWRSIFRLTKAEQRVIIVIMILLLAAAIAKHCYDKVDSVSPPSPSPAQTASPITNDR